MPAENGNYRTFEETDQRSSFSEMGVITAPTRPDSNESEIHYKRPAESPYMATRREIANPKRDRCGGSTRFFYWAAYRGSLKFAGLITEYLTGAKLVIAKKTVI